MITLTLVIIKVVKLLLALKSPKITIELIQKQRLILSAEKL